MLMKPLPLSQSVLGVKELEADLGEMKKYGPCGVGPRALYLNGRFLERRYYIPFTAVQRVYKRVAMSKGGFTGKGVFGSMPYLVVEFDGCVEKQFPFKYEEQVDLMLSYIGKLYPEMKLFSKAGEARLAEKARRLAEKKAKQARSEYGNLIAGLEKEKQFLEQEPELYTELSAAAKAKRTFERTSPAYKWVALFIVLAGVLSCGYGILSFLQGSGDFAVYFLLFGLAAIFLFSGANVLPTAKNNKAAIEKRFRAANAAMAKALEGRESFPLPARYAHPGVLNRMIEVLADSRAASVPQALEVVKTDLKALNSSVTVEQEEYDEIIAIKPLFLVNEYK